MEQPTSDTGLAGADRGPAVVHATAEIELDVSIGAGTRIWRNAHLRRGATVGADCVIGANVFIDEKVSVGDRVKIENNVSVHAGVRLEAEVFVGPGVVFTNDRYPRAVGEWELVPTVVRRGASIGGNATLVCGSDIGEHAMVAAGAVVTRSVEPQELVAGNPARRLGWVCGCGAVLARTDGPFPAGQRCRRCGRVAGASVESDDGHGPQ